MAETIASKFECSECGAKYAWKPQLAGRKVRCKCGEVMRCPAEDPSTAQDLYDLADSPGAPIQPVPVKVIPMAGISSADAVATPASPLGYARAMPVENDLANDLNAVGELVLPIAIFWAGLVLSILQMTQFSAHRYSFLSAISNIGVRLAIDMVLIALGCLATIKLMNVGLGAPGPAVLKLAGIALIGPSIGELVSYLIHDPIGYVGWSVSVLVIWALFMKLFDMDFLEVVILSTIVWMIRLWVGYAIMAMILSGMGMGMTGPKVAMASINADKLARATVDTGKTVDAKPWLDETTNHVFGNTPNTVCLSLVTGFIADGCKMPQLLKTGPQADELIAELPSDATKRTKIFAAAAVFCKSSGDVAPIDEGQTYLILNFATAPPAPARRPIYIRPRGTRIFPLRRFGF